MGLEKDMMHNNKVWSHLRCFCLFSACLPKANTLAMLSGGRRRVVPCKPGANAPRRVLCIGPAQLHHLRNDARGSRRGA